jgi:hypothetical protein
MDKSDFAAIDRELRYQDFMIRYLQEEQKKRWQELNELERRLERIMETAGKLDRLKNDPQFKKLVMHVKTRKTK